MSARISVAAVCLALALACVSSSAAAPGGAAAFSAACLSNRLWTGAVVMAGTTETVLFKQAWGWMDNERRMPMRVDAMFDLASVTKAVGTATAVALCIDRGWVDPDAAFTNYLPGYTGALKGPVTVRDLARHLSGFNNRKPYDQEGRVVERVLQLSPARAAGAPYEYACANFILLGLIVEQVSGRSLDAFTREHVFEPLGMRDTRWAPLLDPDPMRVVGQAIKQTFGVASDEPARHAGRPLGNAGLFSTVEDLSAFCRMMLAGGRCGEQRILSEAVLRELGTRPDTRSPAALGWRADPAFNPASLSEKTLSHTGWAGNSLWIDPGRQRYVVVLTNRTGDHEEASKARTELAQRVLQETGI